MTALDWYRLGNSALTLVTVFFMARVTWRLFPGMEWWEVGGRVGITIVFMWLAEGTLEGMLRNADPRVSTFGVTTGLLYTALCFAKWASTLPPRPYTPPRRKSRR